MMQCRTAKSSCKYDTKDFINILLGGEAEMGYERLLSLLYKERDGGIARFENVIWNLRGKRKISRKESCPLCEGAGGVVHILIKYSEKRKWRDKMLSRKWLIDN
jgi:hypothetical protein